MRKGDRQRIPHRRPDRDRGKGVVAARAIQVAKPQTRIAELPFSAINLRRWRPGNATVSDSFRLVGRKAAFHNEHGVLDLGGQMVDRAKSSTVLQAIA
jgi:hypothetical protein